MSLALVLLFTSSLTIAMESQVTLAVDPEHNVGSSKKGLLCLPAGRLEVKDIAFPDALDIAGRIGDASVRGRIVSIDATVCTAAMGIGNAPKSKLDIRVEWDSADLAGCREVAEASIKVKDRDLRRDPTVMLDAIEQSYRKWRNGEMDRYC